MNLGRGWVAATPSGHAAHPVLLPRARARLSSTSWTHRSCLYGYTASVRQDLVVHANTDGGPRGQDTDKHYVHGYATPPAPRQTFLKWGAGEEDLWDQLLYQYYNWRQDTSSDLQLFLAAFVLLVTTAGLLRALVVESHLGPAISDVWRNFYEVIVLSFGQDLPHANESSTVQQVFSVGVAGVGLASFALVLALVEQVVLELVEENVRRGSPVHERGHMLVLGWCLGQRDFEVVSEVLLQLCEAYRVDGGTTVVVMTERPKLDMEATFRNLLPVEQRHGTQFVFRTGNPLVPGDLQWVSATTAAAIIVVADQSRTPDQADAQSLRCAILLDEMESPKPQARSKSKRRRFGRHHRSSQPAAPPPPPTGHIVVQLLTSNALPMLSYSCSSRAVGVPTAQFNARRLALLVRQPIISVISQQLLSFDTPSSLYVQAFPSLQGMRFCDAAFRFDNATLLGVVQASGRGIMNPLPGHRIAPDEALILLRPTSESARTFRPNPTGCADDIDIGTWPLETTDVQGAMAGGAAPEQQLEQPAVQHSSVAGGRVSSLSADAAWPGAGRQAAACESSDMAATNAAGAAAPDPWQDPLPSGSESWEAPSSSAALQRLDQDAPDPPPYSDDDPWLPVRDKGPLTLLFRTNNGRGRGGPQAAGQTLGDAGAGGPNIGGSYGDMSLQSMGLGDMMAQQQALTNMRVDAVRALQAEAQAQVEEAQAQQQALLQQSEALQQQLGQQLLALQQPAGASNGSASRLPAGTRAAAAAAATSVNAGAGGRGVQLGSNGRMVAGRGNDGAGGSAASSWRSTVGDPTPSGREARARSLRGTPIKPWVEPQGAAQPTRPPRAAQPVGRRNVNGRPDSRGSQRPSVATLLASATAALASASGASLGGSLDLSTTMQYMVPLEYITSACDTERVLVCGWYNTPFMTAMLHELDHGSSALPAGSEVVMLNHHPVDKTVGRALQAVHLTRITVRHVRADPLQRLEMARAIDIAQFQAAVVLCDHQWVDADLDNDADLLKPRDMLRLDALVMMVQLNVRKLLEDAERPTINVICQKLATEGLTRFEDRHRLPMGISVNFASYAAKVLTQAAYNPAMLLPYASYSEASEFAVLDASELAALGEKVTFWQLMRRAQETHQILLGYYKLPLSVDTPVETVINPRGPGRYIPRTWNRGDGLTKFIVLREHNEDKKREMEATRSNGDLVSLTSEPRNQASWVAAREQQQQEAAQGQAQAEAAADNQGPGSASDTGPATDVATRSMDMEAVEEVAC